MTYETQFHSGISVLQQYLPKKCVTGIARSFTIPPKENDLFAAFSTREHQPAAHFLLEIESLWVSNFWFAENYRQMTEYNFP